MARITVEDCLENVDNRFELVLAAAQRARQLSLGADPRVERENDKPTVIALREIAAGHVTRDVLDEDDFSADFQGDVEAELAAELEASSKTETGSAEPDSEPTGT